MILVASALQTAMYLIIQNDPEVASEENPVPPEFAIATGLLAGAR
jgi:hypothetical protein